MKKKLMALTLAAAAALLVWGCGGKDKAADIQPVTETEEVTTAETGMETTAKAGTEAELVGETQPNGGIPDEYSFRAEVLAVTDGELRVRLLEDCGSELKQDEEVVVFFNNGDFNEGDTVYIEFNGMLMSEESVRLAATVLYVTE